MDFNTSQSSLNSPVYQEDYQRNPNFDYDSKLNQFTFQQIEIYLQSQVSIVFYFYRFSMALTFQQLFLSIQVVSAKIS